MSVKAGIVRRRRGALLALVAGAVLAVPVANASAATVTAGPLPISYLNSDVTIAPGESLTFMNLDLVAPHDVTALDFGDNFQPLFRSETVGFGTTVPVVGAETLGGGTYPFICSIHSNMEGTLTVTGPPGGGGGDNDAPSLKVKPVDSRAGAAAKAGELEFKVKVDEASKLRIAAAKGKTSVAKGTAKLKKGTSTVSARLTKAGKKLLRKSGDVTLKYVATATDAAGNTSKKTGKVELS